jgi:hypothetical protein
MTATKLWAALTFFWSAVTVLGIIGMFLEASGRGWWLIGWWGGAILAAICSRRWEVERKRRLQPTLDG